MSAVRALREKLDEHGMAGLHMVIDEAGRRWRDEVLGVAGERFERRLAHEIGALRVDFAKEFAAVRTEMAQEFAELRAEIAKESAALRAEMAKESADIRREVAVGLAQTHAGILKWAFLFWIGQFAAMSAMMALLLRTVSPR